MLKANIEEVNQGQEISPILGMSCPNSQPTATDPVVTS